MVAVYKYCFFNGRKQEDLAPTFNSRIDFFNERNTEDWVGQFRKYMLHEQYFTMSFYARCVSTFYDISTIYTIHLLYSAFQRPFRLSN